MEIVVEVVAARTQRRQLDGDCLAGRHRGLAIQLKALELDRLVARIDDMNFKRLIGWHLDVERVPMVIGELDRRRDVIGRRIRRQASKTHEYPHRNARDDRPKPLGG